MQIITRDRSGTLTELFEAGQLGKLTLAFEVHLAKSLAEDKARATQSEVKRRFNILLDITLMLRRDMKWGVDRILYHLPTYFRAELDGKRWEPSNRVCWMPDDGDLA